ncbi:MAG: hydroxyisourate hydrolase [Bdellovibrionota bacterium]
MISTHILDTSLGHPAQGVAVQLEKRSGDQWKLIEMGLTNSDGRILFQCPSEAATYRLTFQVEEYFKKNKSGSFFTVIPVLFQITDPTRKYHIPLLLNPYGYSTYRGS